MLASVERLSRTLADSTASSSDLAPSVDTAFSPDTPCDPWARALCSPRRVFFSLPRLRSPLFRLLPAFHCCRRPNTRPKGARNGTASGCGGANQLSAGQAGPRSSAAAGTTFRHLRHVCCGRGANVFDPLNDRCLSCERERERAAGWVRASRPLYLFCLTVFARGGKRYEGEGGAPGALHAFVFC